MPITTLRRQAMAHRYSAARDAGDVVTSLLALASDPRGFSMAEVRTVLDRTAIYRQSMEGVLWADGVFEEWCVDEASARALALCAEAIVDQRDILGPRAFEFVGALRDAHRMLGMLLPFVDCLEVEGPED